MSTPVKPKQPASRWAFISQAVASVESGLDRILAEEEDPLKKPQPKQAKPQENGSSSRASSDIKRSDSNSKTNDRLQARLAQAMVKKNASRATTPVPDSNPASRPDTPALGEIEQPSDQKEDSEATTSLGDPEQQRREVEEHSGIPVIEVTASPKNSLALDDGPPEKASNGSQATGKMSVEERPSQSGSERPSKDLNSQTSQLEASIDPDETIFHIQVEHEKSLTNLQDEINTYLERIDTLQRNLQTLTQESIQNAQAIKSDATVPSSEKKLADKDEKIALLIEEGTKLTKSELQYRSMIKKLRTQTTNLTKEQDAVRQRAEKAEQSAAVMRAKINNAESQAKRQEEQISELARSSVDLAAITKERDALNATLADVRGQLNKSNKRAEDAESKARSDRMAVDQRKITELSEDLSSAKIERELAEGKLKKDIEQLNGLLTREKEQARQMETEMLAEQAALESKLESFRVRAEEATAGDGGDSHAKLLRQIETLQGQYSAASQNWQGIESTLLGRITTLEKERDEVVSRENDVRRKLRDASNKARNASKELEDTQQSLHALQDQEADNEAESQRLTKRVEQLENENSRLRRELEEQRSRAEKETTRRIDEEKAKWLASSMSSRVDSPVTSMRRGMGNPFADSLMSPLERPGSRRSSTHHFHDSSISRINSSVAIRTNGPIPETPSISIQDDQDDFFANVPATPASATHADSTSRHGVNEVISASTAGVGPSVQLVERMSANVRRLESEKAASKDEITRLSAQRDEARQEVVNLMREVEAKRAADGRLTTIEKEHAELSAKHQATLELLGEKSEQVEELKADILDVKQMYRQLADTMGK